MFVNEGFQHSGTWPECIFYAICVNFSVNSDYVNIFFTKISRSDLIKWVPF